MSPEITTEPPLCPFRACNASENRCVVATVPDFDYATVPTDCEIVLCQDCGIRHLAQVPDERAMSVIYPSNYYSFRESETEPAFVRAVRGRVELAKIRRYCGLLPEGRIEVLDVGCGDGRLLDIFLRHPLRDWVTSGVEIGSVGARAAAAKGHEVLSGDFMKLDTQAWEGRFDLVLMHQVIEHVHDPKRAIEKIAALMRPGGVLSVETPDTDSWDSRLFSRRHWGGYHAPRHFYLFTKETLGRLMSENGLTVVAAQSIFSPVIWVHSLHHYLMDKPAVRRFFDRAPFRVFDGWQYYRSAPLLTLFTAVDALQILFTGKSSNQQMLARKQLTS